MQELSTLSLKGRTIIKAFDKNGKAKPLFKENSLWKAIKKLTSFDLRIPGITGFYTTDGVIRKNLVVTVGKAGAANRLGGTNAQGAFTALAVGIGTSPAAAGDTTLGSEITTGNGARHAATVTNTTITTSGDTEQWVYTWTFSAPFAVTEEGIFDNNSSGGVLLARNVFSAINVVSTDSLQITHQIQLT